ncbi:hypothetical protein [Halodesulfovibrio spirochaetisodalis]|uniref:Uncharacterized protein n=1 Tax=Halodesulfovibrio spirochaetisodalis TaxID=1560234 RepID=A0A1B7XAN4_9BACT|nr:hypothetical protein [Halodesulfovibrio spirochaetisodalis]OBQ46387.1 hypothetical protein SP90_12705 [Halodesulfovibrio spirochaetisodalis]
MNFSIRSFLFSIVFVLSCALQPANAVAQHHSLQPNKQELASLVAQAQTIAVDDRVLLAVLKGVYTSKISKECAVNLLAAIIRTHKDGLPVSILEAKINEGLAKKVPVEIICTVIRRISEDMDFSRKLIAQYQSAPLSVQEMQTMVEALEQLQDNTQVRDFFARYKQIPVAIRIEGIKTYSLLQQAGGSPKRLRPLMAEVMKNETRLQRWKELPQLLAIALRTGIEPDIFIQKAVAAIKKNKAPHELSREFSLQPRNLGISTKSN